MIFCFFRRKQFPIVCHFSSTYSLLLYLCYSSQKEIDDTFFVFSETFPKEIANNFENSCFIPKYKECSRFYVQKKWIISRYFKWFCIPKVKKTTKVFSQDHTTMLQLLIGNHPYIMVAENPIMEEILKNYIPNQTQDISPKQYIYVWMYQKLVGPIYGCHWGYNNLCYGALIEDKDSEKFFEGKKIVVLNLKKAWNNKAVLEKNKLLRLYGLNISELEVMKKKKVIVFTQPFVPEMTIEENQKFMVRLINKYSHEDVVIKVHPRDKIDYEQLFPDILVCKSRFPAQLFDLLNIHFEIAATYNSSAVYNLSYDIRIDWYGEELKCYSDVPFNTTIPPNVNICHL